MFTLEWITELGDTINRSALIDATLTIGRLYATKKARGAFFLYLAGPFWKLPIEYQFTEQSQTQHDFVV